MKLKTRATATANSPGLVAKLIVGSALGLPEVFDAPLAGDVAVPDELVPVTVVFVTMCVQLSLDGIEKLLLIVMSAHYSKGNRGEIW